MGGNLKGIVLKIGGSQVVLKLLPLTQAARGTSHQKETVCVILYNHMCLQALFTHIHFYAQLCRAQQFYEQHLCDTLRGAP